jgi:hypothetical protein
MVTLNAICCVMAHGDLGAQLAFDRHLPFWRNHGCQIYVVSPTNSPVRTGLHQIPVGPRQHHGSAANARMRRVLFTLLDMPAEWYIIHEYDSLCLMEVPGLVWERPVLWANVFPNDDPSFEGKIFFHPPLIMPRATLRAICSASANVRDAAEHGFWDRWLGLVCERAGIPFEGYGPNGYSQNTIANHHLPEAIKAVRAGARMIHGIKSPSVLDALDEAANDNDRL